MRTKIELNGKDMTILTMIYELSAGKGYMFLDQLNDFLLYFNVYEDKKKIYRAIEDLCDAGILNMDNPWNKYSVVSLTHFGGSYLDRKQYGKKEFDEKGKPIVKKLDIRKPIMIKRNMLKSITFRAEMVMKFFKDNHLNSDFSDAIKMLTLAKNTFLFTESLDECIEFYSRLPKNNQTISDHISCLQKTKGLLIDNLPQNNSKSTKLEKTDTLWTMMKKNLFIATVSNGLVIYTKAITNFDYNYEKLVSDVLFLDDYHRYVFGEEYAFNFQIWVKTKDEKTNVEDAMQWLELSTSKKVSAHKIQYNYRKNYISIYILDKDIDKYFAVKK